MKKLVLFAILLILLCPALVWGYMWLLNTYIPSLLLSEGIAVYEEASPAVEKNADTPLEEVTVPRKSIIKVEPEKADLASPLSDEQAASPKNDDSLESIVAEILARSENLEKEITVYINGYSDTQIVDKLLESRKYYGLSWKSGGELENGVIAITPKYKIVEEILYAHRTGNESVLSRKGKVSYDIAREIISGNVDEGMSDYEKALALHDYLVENTRYDMNAANTVYDGTRELSDSDDSFTAFGPLFNRKGVCQAYSEAFRIFMELLGIECEEVTGEAGGEPHAWNRIKLDGDYYNIDATFDDPYPDSPGEVSHAYFCLTDEMLAVDHTWEQSDKKCVSVKYNYFTYNNLIVRNQSDFDRVIAEAVEKNQNYAEMKLEGFDIDNASFDYAAALTGTSRFRFSETGEQGVVKVYLKNS